MKLIQARVPEAEYELLKRAARAEGETMQTWIRTAIRDKLFPDTVNPADPVFKAFPLIRSRGRKTNFAEEHDELLYAAPKG